MGQATTPPAPAFRRRHKKYLGPAQETRRNSPPILGNGEARAKETPTRRPVGRRGRKASISARRFFTAANPRPPAQNFCARNVPTRPRPSRVHPALFLLPKAVRGRRRRPTPAPNHFRQAPVLEWPRHRPKVPTGQTPIGAKFTRIKRENSDDTPGHPFPARPGVPVNLSWIPSNSPKQEAGEPDRFRFQQQPQKNGNAVARELRIKLVRRQKSPGPVPPKSKSLSSKSKRHRLLGSLPSSPKKGPMPSPRQRNLGKGKLPFFFFLQEKK